MNTSVRDDLSQGLKIHGIDDPRDTLIRDTISCHYGTVNATFMTGTPVFQEQLMLQLLYGILAYFILRVHHRVYICR